MWAFLARVSSDEQATESESIDHQLAALHQWAERNGIAHYRDFMADGESAWTDQLDERPVLKEIVQRIRSGEIDEGFATVNVRRFARSLVLGLSLAKEFSRRRVRFVTLETGDLDVETPNGLLQFVIHGGFAEFASASQSHDIRRGLLKRAENGLHVGTVPFGYCNGKCPGCQGPESGAACERWGRVPAFSPMILHPVDAPGVVLAYNTFRIGTYTDAALAKFMNDAGYRSRTREGRVLWNKHSIQWLLTNPTYTGKVVIKGQVFPGQHPALITPELFDEVQTIRRQHQKTPRTFTPKYRIYLFNGILVCAGCGRKMRASAYGGETNAHRGYRCTAVESQHVKCDRSQSMVRAEELEDEFGEILKRSRLPEDWRERVIESLQSNGERRNVEGERRSLREQLDRMKWLYVRGDLEREEYLREREAIENRLRGLIVPREREVLDAGTYLQNLAEIWDEATMAERREMVQILLERVVCDPTEKRLTALRPRVAFLPLFRQLKGLQERGDEFVIEEN